MLITLAHVGAKSAAKEGFEAAVQDYLKRSTLVRCQSEEFRTEDGLLDWIGKQQGRTAVLVVLLDSRGRQMSSEDFAGWLGERRDQGVQHVLFAVGPPDGWSDVARKRATFLLSLGPMTLAHGLARLLIAEQIYRAFTILTGHPYHKGH